MRSRYPTPAVQSAAEQPVCRAVPDGFYCPAISMLAADRFDVLLIDLKFSVSERCATSDRHVDTVEHAGLRRISEQVIGVAP